MSKAITYILTICAVVVTVLFAHQQLTDGPRENKVEIWKLRGWNELTDEGNRIGSESALVQIIIFSDYECPFCKRVNPVFNRILDMYDDEVALIYRHMILENIHPNATKAALAVECASAQGIFKAYHDEVYQHVESLSQEPWLNIAKSVGVPDLNMFKNCLAQKKFMDRIQSDNEVAESLGLQSIPTVIINGSVLSGAHTFMQYDKIIRQYLK